jgi:hypothetical protein
MPRNNWTPVVLDLLYLLTEEGGATLVFVDDTEEITHLAPPESCQLLGETRRIAAEAITAVDMSALRIMLRDEVATLSIVLGNAPEEIIQDWSAPICSRTYWMLEAITSKFSRQWEDKPCPVIEDKEPEPIGEQAYVKAAKRLHEREGTLEIDDEPKVSEGSDEGAYVAAWVWVYDEDVTAEDRA